MSIVDSELKFYKSATVDDTTSNGGVMTSTLITSGVLQNVFPHALAAERVAGSTKYRKIFGKVANDDDLTLLSPQVWIDVVTAADDWVTMFAGTQTDTQNDIGTPRLYGCASLKTDVSIGGGTLVVTVEDASITGIFVDGDTIRVTDMEDPDSGTGNEEFHVISGTPSVSDDEVTITLTDTLSNAFLTADDTRVMSVYEPSDILCSVDNWVETGAFTYDEVSYEVVCDNIGTIEQTWTLTFSDDTNFTVSGNTVGALASGVIGTDYDEDNPDFTKPYFTLLSAGWGGTAVNGNTLVFQTHPASVPIWEERVIPAGATALSTNKTVLVLAGESV